MSLHFNKVTHWLMSNGHANFYSHILTSVSDRSFLCIKMNAKWTSLKRDREYLFKWLWIRMFSYRLTVTRLFGVMYNQILVVDFQLIIIMLVSSTVVSCFSRRNIAFPTDFWPFGGLWSRLGTEGWEIRYNLQRFKKKG